MLRLLKKLGMPNVMSFELSDPAYNTTALLSGFTIKERDFYPTSKILRVSKANAYLAKQFKRLEKAAKAGEYKKFDTIAINLLTKSTSYLVYSFNSVMPKWTSMEFSKANKLLISAHKLRSTMATEIDYKRVWIDKQPGDYARPLGVPTASWRIYLRMITNLGEIFAKGRDLYSPHQHGGQPGYGVMSCLTDVAKMLEKFPKVFEFDLKGFFDHISHESMTTIFKGTFLEDIFTKMLKVQPKSYVLPPIKDDKATKIYLETQEKYNTIRRLIESVRAEYYEALDSKGKIIWGGGSRVPNYRALRKWSVRYAMVLNEISYLESNLGVDRYVYDGPKQLVKQLKVLAKIQTGDLFKYVDYPVDLMNRYSDIMKTEMITKVKGLNIITKPVTTKDREIGRDSWKDLNLPEQGVPQGSAFGPFLSSLAVAVYFKEQGLRDWKMYIDDGLIFHRNDNGLAAKMLKVKKALARMKVELQPSKSKIHTRESLMTNSIKFLGVRFRNVQERSFFTMSSDTRAGTKRELPPLDKTSMLRILENLLSDGLITISKYRFAKWAVAKSTIGEVVGASHVNLAIKYGYFGYLLSWLFNPELSIEELKARIKAGCQRAVTRMLRQERSWGAYVLNTSNWSYQDNKGMWKVVRPDLNNHSTICVDLLLETLEHGYVSLQEFRLVSNGAIIYSNTIGRPGAKYNQVPQYSSAKVGASYGSSNWGHYSLD